MAGGSSAGVDPAGVDEVLESLSASGTLDLLGISTETLHEARYDSALFERLRIYHQLLEVLRDEGVLGPFLLLPQDEQANFVRWVGAMDEERLRHARTETFIAALRQSPLADGARHGAAE